MCVKNDLIKPAEVIDYKLTSTEKSDILQRALDIFKKGIRNEVMQIFNEEELDEVLNLACDDLADGDHAFVMEYSGKLCEKCGYCCQIADPIKITHDNVASLEEYFDDETVINDLIYEVKGNYYFKQTQPCYFLKENKCAIYDVRPFICRIFPYVQLEDGRYALCKHKNCNFINNFLAIKVFWNLFTCWIERVLALEKK